MTATIEQVEDNDFIISRPVVGGVAHQLGTHERVHVAFVTATKRLSAETCCLGRAKIPSGGKRMLYGYRMLLPEALEIEERRVGPRTTVGPQLALIAELASFCFKSPVRANIVDLSAGGLQVRSNAAAGRFVLDQQVYVTAELPEPAGKIGQMGQVAWVRKGKTQKQMLLGIRFLEPVECIDEYVRISGQRQAQRRRAG
ncbi:MAG: PilZ domain-containing protein [Phycisphaerales bacterium]|nr:MAG: PilZ domain-containing protein [Phycisphaerales bacterium]